MFKSIFDLMMPSSYSGLGPVTSNTRSKRKKRLRTPLPLKPTSFSATKPYAKRSRLTRKHNNSNNKKAKTVRTKKRKRDPPLASLEDSFNRRPQKRIKAEADPDYVQPDDDIDDMIEEFTTNIKPIKTYKSARRRSTRLQNKNNVKTAPKDVPLIDLCNDEQNEYNDNDSNSSTTNNKMSVDEDSDDNDVDLIQDVVMRNNNVSDDETIDTKQQQIHVIDDDDEEIEIDLEDIELPLLGIAIGKHTDFWSTKADDDRPKIVINKHQNAIELHLKSIHGDFVKVAIETKEIESLFLPTNPSFHSMDDLKISAHKIRKVKKECNNAHINTYIQCMFVQTKQKLSVYQWLATFYDPNDMQNPGSERIALFIDYKNYSKFKKYVMNKLYFCELRNAVKNIKYVRTHKSYPCTSII